MLGSVCSLVLFGEKLDVVYRQEAGREGSTGSGRIQSKHPLYGGVVLLATLEMSLTRLLQARDATQMQLIWQQILVIRRTYLRLDD